jgi:hypothetical protein
MKRKTIAINGDFSHHFRQRTSAQACAPALNAANNTRLQNGILQLVFVLLKQRFCLPPLWQLLFCPHPLEPWIVVCYLPTSLSYRSTCLHSKHIFSFCKSNGTFSYTPNTIKIHTLTTIHLRAFEHFLWCVPCISNSWSTLQVRQLCRLWFGMFVIESCLLSCILIFLKYSVKYANPEMHTNQHTCFSK